MAALAAWHEAHDAAADALAGVEAIPAHALAEAYSVLTRLPAGLAVPATTASDILARRFTSAPLELPAAARPSLLATLAAAGVSGGSTYDGIVALQAAAHGERLLTLDRRAVQTYGRLGVAFELLAA